MPTWFRSTSTVQYNQQLVTEFLREGSLARGRKAEGELTKPSNGVGHSNALACFLKISLHEITLID
jgi:hypothetical protein